MNREIKFRAWNKNIKTMEEVASTSFPPPENIILLQFTGLKDKNGKEIYEGDIVTISREKVVVKWKEGGFWYETSSTDDCEVAYQFGELPNSKILGNIYENPELLN